MLAIIILIILFFILTADNNEHFMSYDQKRTYFHCKYGGNPYAENCSHFYKELEDIKRYIVNNPVGYVYSEKQNGNRIVRPLSVWYDRDTRKYHYYVIDYQNKHSRYNTIVHSIKTDKDELYNNDIINVPGRGEMKIRLYKDAINRFSTIYNEARYRPLVHPYFGNRQDPYVGAMYNNHIPTVRSILDTGIINQPYMGYSDWRIVGYLTGDEKYYKLYEKEYSRNNYIYTVQIYPGFHMNVTKDGRFEMRDRLAQNDKVKIDSHSDKEFTVNIHKYDDLVLP